MKSPPRHLMALGWTLVCLAAVGSVSFLLLAGVWLLVMGIGWAVTQPDGQE